MSIISAKNLIYKIVKRNENNEITGSETILDGINTEIEQGEFVVIAGRNGSGKSTFARQLNALLIPTEGQVIIDGNNTADIKKLWEIRKTCGMVFQNPDNQIVGVTLEEDVAFGLENLRVDSKKIEESVTNSLKKVGMSKYRYRSTNELSGGQKQRLSISSVLAMKPKCIVFDEVTSMLDPKGRKDVLEIINELNKKDKITIIYITHDMNEVINADRIYLIDHGKCKFSGSPKELFKQPHLLNDCGVGMPTVTSLAAKLCKKKILSRSDITEVNELSDLFFRENKFKDYSKAIETQIATNDLENKDDILTVENISFSYTDNKTENDTEIKNVSVKFKKGEFVGIIGHTGSGKSTLVQLIDGLYKPSLGVIRYGNSDINKKDFDKKTYHQNVGLVFQYPESQIFDYTVLDDVMFGPKNMGMTKDKAKEQALKALELMNIQEKYYKKPPFNLSGGEKRRVAIAGVLAMNPEILILDEPTAGLDVISKQRLYETLKRLQTNEGKTIIVVSHNMEDIAMYASRIIVMDDGEKILDGNPGEVFSNRDILKKSGLDVPEITSIMDVLIEKGNGARKEILTMDDAVDYLSKATQEI